MGASPDLELALNASEYCRAEGALLIPGGVPTLSIFFRRESQSAGTFELVLHTAPIWFQPLDNDYSQNVGQYLYPLVMEPATGLQMPGTNARTFGARINPAQPMGTLLFWEVKNTVAAGNIVGDIYLVPNHTGVLSMPAIQRTVDATAGGGMGNGAVAGAGGIIRAQSR